MVTVEPLDGASLRYQLYMLLQNELPPPPVQVFVELTALACAAPVIATTDAVTPMAYATIARWLRVKRDLAWQVGFHPVEHTRASMQEATAL